MAPLTLYLVLSLPQSATKQNYSMTGKKRNLSHIETYIFLSGVNMAVKLKWLELCVRDDSKIHFLDPLKIKI